jgi:hypothetical protein
MGHEHRNAKSERRHAMSERPLSRAIAMLTYAHGDAQAIQQMHLFILRTTHAVVLGVTENLGRFWIRGIEASRKVVVLFVLGRRIELDRVDIKIQQTVRSNVH